MYTIYMLTSPSQRKYIGYTSRPLKKRLQDHISDAKRIGRSKIHKALNKYPIDQWDVRVLLETTERDVALRVERECIVTHDTVNQGYNISTGGECGAEGAKRSIETRVRISEAKRGHPQFKDPQYRQKLSDSRRGKARPQSQKDKARDALSHDRVIYFIDGREELIQGLRAYSQTSGIPLSTLNFCQRRGVEVPKWNLKSIKKLNKP